MVVAAASGFVAVGLGNPHGRLASMSMLLLACAGLALVRAGTRHRQSAGSVSSR
jgi:hypothetical protein